MTATCNSMLDFALKAKTLLVVDVYIFEVVPNEPSYRITLKLKRVNIMFLGHVLN